MVTVSIGGDLVGKKLNPKMTRIFVHYKQVAVVIILAYGEFASLTFNGLGTSDKTVIHDETYTL